MDPSGTSMQRQTSEQRPGQGHSSFDHDSDPNFLSYYAEASLSDETLDRFRRVRDNAIRLLQQSGRGTDGLHVADIGCGAGTSSRLWAELGHHVNGLDVNRPLIELARQRACVAGMAIAFEVGSATALPYPDASMDVVFMPELLEHVADWQSCLTEAARVLVSGGCCISAQRTSCALCSRSLVYRCTAGIRARSSDATSDSRSRRVPAR